VAIKVPRSGSLAGGDDFQRFLREARSVARLRHPSIVSVHEVGQHDGVPFLVEDFVRGTTLADLLSARRPSFHRSAEGGARVAEALHYAHQQGVVHRDVKPGNILLEAAVRGPIPKTWRQGSSRAERATTGPKPAGPHAKGVGLS